MLAPACIYKENVDYQGVLTNFPAIVHKVPFIIGSSIEVAGGVDEGGLPICNKVHKEQHSLHHRDVGRLGPGGKLTLKLENGLSDLQSNPECVETDQKVWGLLAGNRPVQQLV